MRPGAMNGRVGRLEHAYGLDRGPESQDARFLRRLDEVIHLIPLDALRRLQAGGDPESRRKLERLMETGEWPV